MAHEVEWAESATVALIEQLDFINRDSPSYAASLSLKAEKAAASLDHFPYRGRAVPEYDDPTIREIQVGSYRLIYQVTEAKVGSSASYTWPAIWRDCLNNRMSER